MFRKTYLLIANYLRDGETVLHIFVVKNRFAAHQFLTNPLKL